MDQLDQNTSQMIGLNEVKAIAQDLNTLLPEKLRQTILERGAIWFALHKKGLGYSEKKLLKMAEEGSLLITVSEAPGFSTEGEGELSYFLFRMAEDLGDDVPKLFPELIGASFGVIDVNAYLHYFMHSSKEGRRRFAVICWHEGQRLDSKARGEFLLTGTTTESE